MKQYLYENSFCISIIFEMIALKSDREHPVLCKLYGFNRSLFTHVIIGMTHGRRVRDDINGI